MKFICIGRNYADHARELKNDLPTEPVIFLKPETALILKRQPFFLPAFSQDIHHEIELLVKINRVGKHIEERFAHRYYDELSVGLDFTARDTQQFLKEKGLPWEKAKAFDGSAAVGEWVSKTDLGNLNDLHFHLEKNGEVVQNGHTSDMIFSIDRLVAEVSKYFTLKKGDILFTGTPAGVGPVAAEDVLTAYLGDQKLLELRVK
jgi:2-keto-4-pentenoate hydratase/2-oxohepta-3-ene-1,7-dioic acid hydratase in catechol pathway